MSAPRQIGHLTNARVHVHAEWKIEDYLNQDSKVGDTWLSSAYLFTESQWHMKLLPKGTEKSEEYISLSLGRSGSKIARTFSFTLGIKSPDGRIYKCVNSTATFLNTYRGVKNFLKISDLDYKDIIDNKGTVTFFFDIYSPEDSKIKTESQISYRNDLNTLSQDFKNLFLDEKSADITIRVKGQEIRAHSQVLAARCSVFHAMFTHDMKEKSTGVVNLEDFNPTIVREFLSFIYSGLTENMSSENVMDLYFIADKYDVKELKSKCSEFMGNNLSVDTFCSFITVAIEYGDDQIIRNATEFFSKNGTAIIKKQRLEFKTFLSNYPEEASEIFLKSLEPEKSDSVFYLIA